MGEVLTATGFSKVYAFAHHEPGTTAEFVKLHTASGHALELTSEHLVHVAGGRNAYVPAKEVEVGDLLTVVDDGSSYEKNDAAATAQRSVVTHVELVTKEGLHTPYTREGSIVVNGVLASSYDDTPPLKIAGTEVVSGATVLHLAT